MANKVSNFSDLIQRVAASCLLHPLAAGRHDPGDAPENRAVEQEAYDEYDSEEEEDEEREGLRVWEESQGEGRADNRVMEMEMLMSEVFETVSSMKRAYVSLQEAHCPWDSDKMRMADVAVVSELRRLGVLRERFRRKVGRRAGGSAHGPVAATLREVVAPYEAAMEDLKRSVKAREVEVENLKEKLKSATSLTKKGRFQSKKKVSCSQGQGALSLLCPSPFRFHFFKILRGNFLFVA